MQLLEKTRSWWRCRWGGRAGARRGLKEARPPWSISQAAGPAPQGATEASLGCVTQKQPRFESVFCATLLDPIPAPSGATHTAGAGGLLHPRPVLTPPPTTPQITSSSPSHPANSFYYPRLKTLPPIARVTLVRLRQSPRAFIPPAMDLAGNDILDSLSGKPGSRPTAWPTATFPDLNSLDSGAKRSGLWKLHVHHWSVGADLCVTRGLAPPSLRQATVDLEPSVPAFTLRLTPKVTVRPGERESDTQRPEMPKCL